MGGGSKNEIKTRGDRGSKLVGGLGPPNVVVPGPSSSFEKTCLVKQSPSVEVPERVEKGAA